MSTRHWFALLFVVSAAGMAVACGGDHPPPTSATATPASPTTTTAAAATATATATSIPASTVPVRHVLANGDELPSDNGLLYIELSSGRMVFWEMPGSYGARPISRDGRWVVWSAQRANGWHLLDTDTGNDRELVLEGEPASVPGISADGAYMVVLTQSKVALVETASLRVIAEAPAPAPGPNGAAEFSVQGAAALGFGDVAKGTATTMTLRPDGSTPAIVGGTWPLRWSPDGSSLAITTTNGTRIVTAAGATKLEIPFGNVDHGFNPRWSPDGRYISIANAYNLGGARVFDASSGAELLRTTGSPTCLGDYWLSDRTMRFAWDDRVVIVPSGEVSAGAPAPQPEFDYDQAAGVGVTRLLLKNGGAVEFRTSASWSLYYDGDGVYATTTEGRALFLIGIGGKGLCDGQLPQPAVSLPPFN